MLVVLLVHPTALLVPIVREEGGSPVFMEHGGAPLQFPNLYLDVVTMDGTLAPPRHREGSNCATNEVKERGHLFNCIAIVNVFVRILVTFTRHEILSITVHQIRGFRILWTCGEWRSRTGRRGIVVRIGL
eukprot:Skav200015  [mRNA]  locus=scaffold1611:22768:26580:- [translate_table: standard]